ncbi:hypothetical protein SYNTR_1860 [Candidatus Syntrophocurvum alkaliphilum]|uniref:PDZ domain-containing protein n=1 Tax=Candidatus Syntrophocurvum alkaliphilum TaxID=2293317 RepID=A0A6I6DHP3_9FIRM|nr:S41 family peptidase [Candidatus Syntrophocurvum alkaliphilum]QGU00454.1 hypothetical protein SYNTR_1860 [Candidatus Syntrophocurvum alkaliphilum]
MSRFRQLLGIIVVVALLVGGFAAPVYADDIVSEVKLLLEERYVEKPPEDIHHAESIDEILQILDDPHTEYLTAEEYDRYISNLDESFTGIGIHIQMEPEGVRVIRPIENSPGEAAGLKAGDLITKADGKSLAGMISEEAVSILQGPIDSVVDLKVKRDEQVLDVSVVRDVIDVPNVTGEIVNDSIGYIDIDSFGRTTNRAFDNAFENLKKESAESLILDLRYNTGGYLSSARQIAGSFIGDEVALQVESSSEKNPYEALPGGAEVDKPTILIMNEFSASASEILAAALKDHEKAFLIGTRTYGKGTVQQIFSLSNGDKLKATINRFYSPNYDEIDGVGVMPDLVVRSANPKTVAKLLLSEPEDKASYVVFENNIKEFTIDFDKVRKPKYWDAWGAVFNETSPDQLTAVGEWGEMHFLQAHQNLRWPMYFPNYRQTGFFNNVPTDQQFSINLGVNVDMNTVNEDSIELIESHSGKAVSISIGEKSSDTIKIKPQEDLEPLTEYWLVVHETVKYKNGNSLDNPLIAVARIAQ